MILIEEKPKVATLAKYVDRYQLFIINEPAFLKTIPNGKIDCYLVKKGGFAKWDIESESFVLSRTTGILPATNKTSFYHIPTNMICLNIKFNLNIIGFSLFSGLLTNADDFDITCLIPEIEQKNILTKISEENPTICVDELDTIIGHSLSNQSFDKKVNTVVKLMQEQVTGKFRVNDLADSMNMSQKSTERWIQKRFNITPKKLLQVIRFQSVSRKLKSQPNSKLIDSLEFGYFDQSHFIKECQKITGNTPKDLFDKMKLSTNDIIFE